MSDNDKGMVAVVKNGVLQFIPLNEVSVLSDQEMDELEKPPEQYSIDVSGFSHVRVFNHELSRDDMLILMHFSEGSPLPLRLRLIVFWKKIASWIRR